MADKYPVTFGAVNIKGLLTLDNVVEAEELSVVLPLTNCSLNILTEHFRRRV
jgi:hypothetical protein